MEHTLFVPLLLSDKQKQQSFFVVINAAVVPALPYSLDFGNCDSYLFAGIKWQLQRCYFQDVSEVQDH